MSESRNARAAGGADATARLTSGGSGAGLNRAQYLGATVDRSPAWLSPRNLYGDVGAVAEAGAELRVSEQLLFTADLRWADLDDDASALRGQNGPVAADPLVLGFSVGYRFR